MVTEPRFRRKSLARSLDNGFCPCSYNCSLILSYFYNFVICSECNCILFVGDINTVNDDDASGVISLVTVSQAGKFFFPAVFPTIVCCWLGTEPRNPAWHTSLQLTFTLVSGHQNEECQLCPQCFGHKMLLWKVVGAMHISSSYFSHKIWVYFSLKLLHETFLILRRNKRGMIKKCILVFM